MREILTCLGRVKRSPWLRRSVAPWLLHLPYTYCQKHPRKKKCAVHASEHARPRRGACAAMHAPDGSSAAATRTPPRHAGPVALASVPRASSLDASWPHVLHASSQLPGLILSPRGTHSWRMLVCSQIFFPQRWLPTRWVAAPRPRSLWSVDAATKS